MFQNLASESRAKYLLRIKRKGERYRFILYDRLADTPVLEFTLGDWKPLVDYLSSDPKYIRGRDYELIAEDGEPVEVAFMNPDCGHRVMVYFLSILGVEYDRGWLEKMRYAVAGMPIDAVWFWFGTAYDWFTSYRDGLGRWRVLMRIAKAIRTLYG